MHGTQIAPEEARALLRAAADLRHSPDPAARRFVAAWDAARLSVVLRMGSDGFGVSFSPVFRPQHARGVTRPNRVH